MSNFDSIVACSTNFKDNRDCCRKSGVADVAEVCLELCHPTNISAGRQFLSCVPALERIVKCNANSYD